MTDLQGIVLPCPIDGCDYSTTYGVGRSDTPATPGVEQDLQDGLKAHENLLEHVRARHGRPVERSVSCLVGDCTEAFVGSVDLAADWLSAHLRETHVYVDRQSIVLNGSSGPSIWYVTSTGGGPGARPPVILRLDTPDDASDYQRLDNREQAIAVALLEHCFNQFGVDR